MGWRIGVESQTAQLDIKGYGSYEAVQVLMFRIVW
jgi:hypothetical protein